MWNHSILWYGLVVLLLLTLSSNPFTQETGIIVSAKGSVSVVSDVDEFHDFPSQGTNAVPKSSVSTSTPIKVLYCTS